MSYPGPPPSSHGANQSFVNAARTHACLASLTFLVVLPLGVLIPRYFRTFTTKWWLAHWILNGFVSVPLVIASWVKAAEASGSGPMNHHKKIGTIIFSLYITQIVLGAFVHFIRIPFPLIVNRPLSNYVHALLGLTILAMSAYQVHHGLYVQWPLQTGNQPPITLSEKHAWLALVIVFWILYFIGTAFLPRQYKQEQVTSTLLGKVTPAHDEAAGQLSLSSFRGDARWNSGKRLPHIRSYHSDL